MLNENWDYYVTEKHGVHHCGIINAWKVSPNYAKREHLKTGRFCFPLGTFHSNNKKPTPGTGAHEYSDSFVKRCHEVGNK